MNSAYHRSTSSSAYNNFYIISDFEITCWNQDHIQTFTSLKFNHLAIINVQFCITFFKGDVKVFSSEGRFPKFESSAFNVKVLSILTEGFVLCDSGYWWILIVAL
jgi:hypothetical protein